MTQETTQEMTQVRMPVERRQAQLDQPGHHRHHHEMNLIVHHAEAGHVPLDQQQEGPLGRRNSGGHLLGLRPEGMALMGR